jgi:flagellar FliL protein
MAKKPKKAANTEDAEGGEGGAAPAKKGGFGGLLKNKFVLIGVAAVVLLGGGGGGAMYFGLLGGGHDEKAQAEGGEGGGEKAAEAKPVQFVDLPEIVVNLATPDREQYLKIKVALEVPDAELAEKIKPLMPRVLDTFQTYMRELRPTDLQGSAGMFRLKEELTKRVNVAVYPAKVDAVLFKEIVVQ